MEFNRPNGTKVSIEEIAEIVSAYIMKDPAAKYELTIGTDSQNYDKTKIVEVIALRKVGRGGIFFFRYIYLNRIDNLRYKITVETQKSLETADALLACIENLGIMLEEYDIHIQIHCDIGTFGPTKAFIKEITSWVRSLGYECCIKPDSYTASAIANKFSK